MQRTNKPYWSDLVRLHDTMTGDDFRALRVKSGLSLRTMGEKCGMSRTSIMKIERQEQYYTTPARRLAVLEAYGVGGGNETGRLHELLTGERRAAK